MRTVVFGATGPTGRQVTEQALAAGHEVVAVTRRPGAVAPRPGLTVVTADALDADAVDRAVAGSDAVLASLGVPLSPRPITVYSRGNATIVAAMHRHGVKRLVTVSSSVLDPRWRPTGEFFFNTVMDPLVNRRFGRTAHEDMRRMEAVVRDSGLDWTIARPSGLFDHHSVTRYRAAEDVADGLFTARSDLAASMVAQLTDDRFVRRAMAVITTDVRPRILGLLWREVVAKKK
ncbi:NAD(P)-dependent oxidoreductase [Micromonospora costi]|uniref:NAD-dependent epimerase/dehydratase family protein n=1 Tax=Micromonospora costi TaxID=1530042 RepID=A0A3B0AB56_9ACTN|nr:NAD(P)H-binding protein [Micromonospora costi]RKN57719.1 NAD-dependent epimerase/dehydratase family protein [Micromonospora costi]